MKTKIHSQIKIHLKNITKIEKYKKLKYKVSKNKHTTDEDKNNQIHLQIKIHLMNITQIGKYKTLNMTEHKADMKITKIDKHETNSTAILWRSTKHMNITKYKKLNMTEHKTDILNTKTDHDRAQNRYEHY